MSLDEIRRETASDKTVYVKCSLVKQMTQILRYLSLQSEI